MWNIFREMNRNVCGEKNVFLEIDGKKFDG